MWTKQQFWIQITRQTQYKLFQLALYCTKALGVGAWHNGIPCDALRKSADGTTTLIVIITLAKMLQRLAAQTMASFLFAFLRGPG